MICTFFAGWDLLWSRYCAQLLRICEKGSRWSTSWSVLGVTYFVFQDHYVVLRVHILACILELPYSSYSQYTLSTSAFSVLTIYWSPVLFIQYSQCSDYELFSSIFYSCLREDCFLPRAPKSSIHINSRHFSTRTTPHTSYSPTSSSPTHTKLWQVVPRTWYTAYSIIFFQEDINFMWVEL